MPSFYEKEDGAALSVTINKFIHVFAHKVPYMGVKCMYDDVEEHHDWHSRRIRKEVDVDHVAVSRAIAGDEQDGGFRLLGTFRNLHQNSMRPQLFLPHLATEFDLVDAVVSSKFCGR